MRCADCRFWERDNAASPILNHGECDCLKFKYEKDLTYCYYDQSDLELDDFLYWDGESYSAAFLTGQDFGCVHFEGKE